MVAGCELYSILKLHIISLNVNWWKSMQASSCADHGRFTETRVGLSSRSPTTQRLSTNTTLPSFAERNHVSLPQRSFQTIVTTTKCPDTSRNGKRDGHLRVHTQRIYAKDGDDCVSLGGLWKQIHIRKAETAEKQAHPPNRTLYWPARLDDGP